MSKPQTVYVVDDDHAVRKSIAMLLESVDLPTKTYSSPDEFLENYEENSPGCALIDMRMPRTSGLMLQKEILRRSWTIPIIFISGNADVPAAVQAMQQGAFDFLTKPMSNQRLLDTVYRAIDSHEQRLVQRRNQQTAAERLERLTPREREVYELLLHGLSNKVVAKKLELSPRTVELHRANVFEKLEVANLVEMVHQQELLHNTIA